MDILSRSRVRDDGGGAVEVEVTKDGKAPGIPINVPVDVDADSGTTPPCRLPNPPVRFSGLKNDSNSVRAQACGWEKHHNSWKVLCTKIAHFYERIAQ
jgi:hypothetical protein